MIKKNSYKSGLILVALVSLILLFTCFGLNELMVYLLSSVLTLGLVAATVCLVQRSHKFDQD